MKSLNAKHSLKMAGKKTSVCLEPAFWNELKGIAAERELTVSNLVALIKSPRENANLSSQIRLFVLDHFRNQAELAGYDCGATAKRGS